MYFLTWCIMADCFSYQMEIVMRLKDKIAIINPNGVLIISAEGGGPINQDNMVSYQINGVQDGWIIQSRDVP